MSGNSHEAYCERFLRHSNASLVTRSKSTSKKSSHPSITTSSKQKECKSCTTAGLRTAKKIPIVRPKKTTRSEQCLTPKVIIKRTTLDYCPGCGDVIGPTKMDPPGFECDDIETVISKIPIDVKEYASKRSVELKESKSRHSLDAKDGDTKENIERCYINENFIQSESLYNVESYVHQTASLQDIANNFRKKSLETIKEASEHQKSSQNFLNYIQNESESESDSEIIHFVDTTSDETVKNLNEFRKDNYFECHSTQSRIQSKGNVTSLIDHKCVYRFYLNDRLFPVPLHTDTNSEIRCIECHLPLKQDKKPKSKAIHNGSINGTIQAKVRIGTDDQPQDIMLMLPVKDSLVIRERRRDKLDKKNEKDMLYFGVIKLSQTGNSVFNPNQPSDSLALKYQKGYKELKSTGDCKYEHLGDDDVIII